MSKAIQTLSTAPLLQRLEYLLQKLDEDSRNGYRPWALRARDINEAEAVENSKDPIKIAADSTGDFLGWEIIKGEQPGRGEMFGPEAALTVVLHNSLEEIVAALRERAT